MSMNEVNPYISEDKKRYTNFCFVLYPDDEIHMIALRYLLKFDAMYHVAYILHDRDSWSMEDQLENSNHIAGEHKKAHYHVLVNMKSPSTITGVQKHLMLQHVENVENISYYLTYMLHQTPECIRAGKPVYNVNELICDKKFKALLDNQNLYFIQLQEIGYYIRANPFVTLEDVIAYINEKNDKSYIDMFDKYQYLIGKIMDNRDRDNDRIYRRTHPMDIIAYSDAKCYLNDKSRNALKESYERVKPKNLEMSE